MPKNDYRKEWRRICCWVSIVYGWPLHEVQRLELEALEEYYTNAVSLAEFGINSFINKLGLALEGKPFQNTMMSKVPPIKDQMKKWNKKAPPGNKK